MAKVERSTTRVVGFTSGEVDFQLMRVLGACTSGGGSPGEILAARSRIEGDDPTNWPGAFGATADDLVAKAEAALAKGHTISARDHLLRASSYLRSAEYFCDPYSDEAQRLGLASADAFARAAPHLPFHVEPVEVPFEGATLPGYMVRPAQAAGANKTVICLTGFDGTAEELYFETAFDGVQRGYTLLLVQGPGQVSTMRRHPELTFRPDYEVPISAIVDFALSRNDVDPDRLALYGISFGGYFVTRAATREHRIKALIANAPIHDMKAYMMGFLGGSSGLPEGVKDVRVEDLDHVPDEYMPPATKLSFKAVCRRYGVNGFNEWLAALEAYKVADLSAIACPALALAGQGEGDETMRQLETFTASVSGPVTKRIFKVDEGADMHCQMGNYPLSNAVIYDWLSETFER